MNQKNELDQSMHIYYEKRAPEYDDWYDRRGRYSDPATNAAWHAQVAELGREAARFGAVLGRAPGLTALDLACGTGKWSPYWLHNLTDSGRLVAFDYSPAMLAETHVRLEDDDPANLPRTAFVRGDAYSLPFANRSFDFVFTGFWLSHVPAERVINFFEEVKRVMKPGANLLIFDSAFRPGVPAQGVAIRPLKDGSEHRVLKINYTPTRLEELLGKVFPHCQARQTRDYFLIAQASL